MKIAYFLPHLVPGGITRSTPALAEQFIHDGHSVDFLSISIHPDTRDEIIQLGINIIDLNASRTVLAIPKLARYLKNENPDILLSAQHYANLVSVWARSLSRQSIPLILTERLAIAEALKYDSPYKRPFMKHLIKLFYPRAQAVVAISHEGARQLEQINNWKPTPSTPSTTRPPSKRSNPSPNNQSNTNGSNNHATSTPSSASADSNFRRVLMF